MKILTFDIEEWFHLLNHESTRTQNEWVNYEIRIHQNVERILGILEGCQAKATFFCLGWIAEKYPEVVRSICDCGFEIGTHTRMHQLIYQQTPGEFDYDLEHSVKSIEDITGKKVKYFRAPGFSIREDNKWAFEVLVKHGIEVDSSIFPAPRAHGGFPSYDQPVPSIIKYNGIELKELPINFTNVLNKSVIFSGGGYFRLLPYSLIRHLTRRSEYVMSYMHPRDFDPGQPMIKDLSAFRKFKSYVGLNTAQLKMERWLNDIQFIDVATAVKHIDWESVPVVHL